MHLYAKNIVPPWKHLKKMTLEQKYEFLAVNSSFDTIQIEYKLFFVSSQLKAIIRWQHLGETPCINS